MEGWYFWIKKAGSFMFVKGFFGHLLLQQDCFIVHIFKVKYDGP